MTPERFHQLADAYGAELRRWPSAERTGAQALLDSGNAQALATLHQARLLDRLLDSHQVPAASPALVRSIVASATLTPAPSFWRRHMDWWSKAGFVGVGLAGIAAGMLVVSFGLPLMLPTSSEEIG